MGVSECSLLDPQQRLLLEATWEAASSVGASGGNSLIKRTRPVVLPGSKIMPGGAAETAVFVGASYTEWQLIQQLHSTPPSTYSASGGGLSVLAGWYMGQFGVA